MRIKVLLLTLGMLLCGMLWGQSMFELLLPISEIDRSNTGYDLLFDPENEHYYVLSNTQIHDYLQTTGIPIEGEFTLGTSLTKLDLNGEIIWNELIRTNCPNDTCPFILELHGRLPAEILMINELGNIVLPYSAFYGFVICDTLENQGSLGNWYFMGKIAEISAADGAILEDDYLSDIINCRKDIIVDAALVNDTVHLMTRDNYNIPVSYFKLNSNLDVISSVQISGRSIGDYDQHTNMFVSLWPTNALIYDETGDLIDSLSFEDTESIFAVTRTFFSCETHLGFLIGGKRLTDDQTVSIVSVYDRNYNRVYHRVFENRKLVDAEFYEGQIVYIESLRSSASSMEEKPIRVGTIDIESQLEESNTFGFPYVDGRKISVFSNGQIGVVGSSVSSFLETSDRRSNQTYVLVTHIADIVSSRALNNPNPEQLTLFPNPATDHLEIKGLFDNYNDKTLEIYDLLGRKIDDCELKDGYSIDISRLPPGIYALILKAGSRILTNGKFVKI